MADRYTYITLIGPFIAVTWGAVDDLAAAMDRSERSATRRPPVSSWRPPARLATSIQISNWRNSVTLYSHALEVTERNYMAHNNLASALYSTRGKLNEAMDHLESRNRR